MFLWKTEPLVNPPKCHIFVDISLEHWPATHQHIFHLTKYLWLIFNSKSVHNCQKYSFITCPSEWIGPLAVSEIHKLVLNMLLLRRILQLPVRATHQQLGLLKTIVCIIFKLKSNENWQRKLTFISKLSKSIPFGGERGGRKVTEILGGRFKKRKRSAVEITVEWLLMTYGNVTKFFLLKYVQICPTVFALKLSN